MRRLFTLAAVAIISIGLASAQTTKEYSFGDFTKISASFIYDIHITKGESNNIKVTSPEKYIEYLDIYVEDQTLHLDANLPKFKKITNNSDDKIIICAEMEEIREIRLSGASAITVDGEFDTDKFVLSMSGATEIENQLNINATNARFTLSGASEGAVSGKFGTITCLISGASELEMQSDSRTADFTCSGASDLQFSGNVTEGITLGCSGASDAEFSGICKNISIICSGASEVDAEEMTALSATAVASGASNIKIKANESLNLKSSGGSEIKYYGNAAQIIANGDEDSIVRGR